MHEICEKALTKYHGISEDEITAFDLQFEEERSRGIHCPYDEPGDDRRAPYHADHKSATKIEKLAAKFLGVNWKQYTEAIHSL